jgi:xylan 1,4-beta-xylosidase
LTWAFEFEDQPYYAGFRALASNGLDLPVLNVFRMYSRMNGVRLATESSAEIALADIMRDGVRQTPDVAALASREGKILHVMVWHYHDDDVSGPDAAVTLAIDGLNASTARVSHHRIDETHSNSYAAWKRLGSPLAPDDRQYAALQAAGQLTPLGEPTTIAIANGIGRLSFSLPRQGVSLLTIELP